MRTRLTRRELLRAGAAAGMVALGTDPLVQRALASRAAGGAADGHRARDHPDPGEPLLRSLFRDPAGRARVLRAPAARSVLSARLSGARLQRGAAALPPGNEGGTPVLSRHHPPVGASTSQLGWRKDGSGSWKRTWPSTAPMPGPQRWATTSAPTSPSTSPSPTHSRSATTTTARCSGPPTPTGSTACRPRSTPTARTVVRSWRRSSAIAPVLRRALHLDDDAGAAVRRGA